MMLIDNKGHLVSDESEDELHKFVFKLGLKREWYQNKRLPHYDVTTKHMRNKAQNMGAIFVSSKEIVKALISL